jgi:hypothetical protein
MYRNFNITEKEKQQILESHMSHGYKQPLNEMGPTWLTKIKVDLPPGTSEEEKVATVKKFQSAWNGLIAVEFEPGEWYNTWGKRVDIDEYEREVENKIFNSPSDVRFRETGKERWQERGRNTERGSAHQYRYDSFDDHLSGDKDKTPEERNAPSRYGF